MKKIIQNKLKAVIEDINERVEIIMVTHEIENEFLHELRLSIKYFKAIYLLCKSLSISIDKEIYEEIKNIHQFSGGLRDAQVQQELLTETEQFVKKPFKKLRSILEEKEQNYILKFKKITFTQLDTPIITKKIKPIIIEELIDEKLYQVHQLDDLHEQRKVVKTLMYWSELLLLKDSTNSEWEQTRLKLKGKASSLGEWHDYDNFIQCIKENDLISKKYLHLIKMIEYKNMILVGK